MFSPGSHFKLVSGLVESISAKPDQGSNEGQFSLDDDIE